MQDDDPRGSQEHASDLWPLAALTFGGALNVLWIGFLLWAMLKGFGLL
ncbi:hypothetical protein [Salinarimonas soli]|nr:hypothetical protein [Salinarimonas soli]